MSQTLATPSMSSSSEYTHNLLLTLSVPPQQADVITDWLLEQGQNGFSSWEGWGHSEDSERMTLSEKIRGKQKRTFISLHLDADACQRLLAGMAEQFQQFDIHFWEQPLLRAGSLAGH